MQGRDAAAIFRTCPDLRHQRILAAGATGPVFRRILCGVDDGRRSLESRAPGARPGVRWRRGGLRGGLGTIRARRRPVPAVAGARGACARGRLRGGRPDGRPRDHAASRLSVTGDRLARAQRRARPARRRRPSASLASGDGGPRRTGGAVLHGADAPVLVARPYDTGAAEPARVLAATSARRDDREDGARRRRAAHRHGARLTVLHVSDVAPERAPRAGEPGGPRALHRPAGPDRAPGAGRPVHGILDIAHSHADTLVVTGAGLDGPAALGSVSERVGARARCSVLALRHRA